MLKLKNFSFFFFFCILIFVLCSSPFAPEDADCLDDLSQYGEGNNLHYFWTTDLDSNEQIAEPFILRASGVNIEIYSATRIQNPLITDQKILDLKNAFDQNIFSSVTTFFGGVSNLDRNRKVILLLHPFDDIGVLAFVSSTDFFDKEIVCSIINEFSNEREVIYMNTDVSPDARITQWSDSNLLLGTLAHEYEHILSIGFLVDKFVTLLEQQRNGEITLGNSYNLYPSFHTWIDEGFAEIASDVAGYGPQSGRLANFSCLSRRESLVRWDNTEGNYDQAYVFFRYLFDRLDCSNNEFCDFTGDLYSAVTRDNIENGESIRLNALYLFEELLEERDLNCNPDLDLFLPNLTCMYENMWANILSSSSLHLDRNQKFLVLRRNLDMFDSTNLLNLEIVFSKNIRTLILDGGYVREYEECTQIRNFLSILPSPSEPQQDLFDFDILPVRLLQQTSIQSSVCGGFPCRLNDYSVLNSPNSNSNFFVSFRRPTFSQEVEYRNLALSNSLSSSSIKTIDLHKEDSSCVHKLSFAQIQKLKEYYSPRK